MPKSSNQKLKLLVLEQLFKETDRENAVTLAQLMHTLDLSGISVSDKTLRDDIAKLREFGYSIQMEQRGRQVYYYLTEGG